MTKKTYAFTTSNTLGTLQSTQTYTYGDANWGDLLTGFGGKTITYDSIGNPVAFEDWDNGEGEGKWDHLTWSGRELQNYYHHAQDGEGDFDLSFTYNADGIRTSKAYEASYDDVYLYDETGSPIGMAYCEVTYAAGVATV